MTGCKRCREAEDELSTANLIIEEKTATIARWEELAEGYLERAQKAEAEVKRMQACFTGSAAAFAKQGMPELAVIMEAARDGLMPPALMPEDWQEAPGE
jgi:hypothetical protein